MAEGRRLGLTPQLDIEQILREAQHRWLRPAEICEILRNYHNFRIAPEPPNRPSSMESYSSPYVFLFQIDQSLLENGSLFLFDRKVLRYFRKDGHNWRKKKDGKTVKEAHEKLKAGSVDVLHCYYAHGEDNENFQRRSYWMLEEELMHIVLVHYREVKGGKASYLQQREDGESIRNSNPDSPACSNSSVNLSQVPSQISDYGSPNSTHQSEYEDADSDNYQSSSRYHSVPEVQQYGSWMNVQLSDARAPAPRRLDQCDHQRPQAAIPDLDSFTIARDSMTKLENPSDVGLTFTRSNTKTDIASWHDIMESCPAGFQTPYDLSVPSSWAATFEDNLERNSFMIQDFLAGDFGTHKEDGTTLASNIMWQFSANESDSLVENSQATATEENVNQMSDLSNKENEGLKKYDSFSRWMSKELGEVDDSQINSNSGIYWSSLESESVVAESNLLNQEQSDTYLMGPLLSQEQLFSIIDFSPNWAYTDLVTKVMVKGKFLMNEENLQKYKWSCMFGEIEVAANILANGTLSCYTPLHKSGRVPFYITCSNRVACSEIREFEYKKDLSRNVGIDDLSNSTLQSRFEKLLLLDSMDYSIPACSHLNERSHADCTICSLIMEVDDETINLFKHDEDYLHVGMKNEDIVSQLKQKLRVWLLHKVGEGDGKGPNVLDEEGQGVLHLAAALGYDWAIKPTVAAGVNINFRDVHGWTAMHWAASCGRERTVVTLIALDASPGALTDPTPEFPTGRTPADLASQNGHKGIAGFLAESSLTNHLRALNLKGSETHNLSKPDSLLGFENLPDRINANLTDGEIQTSLRAVRNATEAAARIFQVFRVQSFNRKQIIKQSDEKFGMSDDRALSLISVKPYKSEQHNMPFHAAAIKIQNKFRGWKGRKEFLITRQRIVKIQAHVRGHQVRKHYKKIIWSVGIVEKVILRWRRKGSGLRGFRPEGLIEGPKDQTIPKKEDDDDFLREGRRQTEVRMEKALARVKSMVQYPEARDQYRRLVTVVTQLQESKLLPADDRNETAGPSDADFMVELEGLIGDYDEIPFRS